MAGVLVNLVPKRVYDFGGLAVGGSAAVVVVDRIDISQYIEGVLILRVHDRTITNGFFFMSLYPDGFTIEDPGLDFSYPNTVYFFPALVFDQNTTPPTVLATGTDNLGGEYASLVLGAQKALSGSLSATISVDLVLRAPS